MKPDFEITSNIRLTLMPCDLPGGHAYLFTAAQCIAIRKIKGVVECDATPCGYQIELELESIGAVSADVARIIKQIRALF
jgi:hypothetical protein